MMVPLIGLQNLGNTCFMNAVLQCFRLNKYLSRLALPMEGYDEQNEHFDICIEYLNLIRECLHTANGFIVPISFWNTLCRKYTEYQSMQQQDSSEFLCRLLYATDLCRKVISTFMTEKKVNCRY